MSSSDATSLTSTQAPTPDQGMTTPNDLGAGDAPAVMPGLPSQQMQTYGMQTYWMHSPDGGVSLASKQSEFSLDTEDGRPDGISCMCRALWLRTGGLGGPSGGGGSADGKADYGFDTTAEANGFCVVYPEGIPAPVPRVETLRRPGIAVSAVAQPVKST